MMEQGICPQCGETGIEIGWDDFLARYGGYFCPECGAMYGERSGGMSTSRWHVRLIRWWARSWWAR
jgi:hypothetical protein